MVLGVVEGLGLDMVAGKGTNHPSLQEINKEKPNLDEFPQKETQERKDKTKCKINSKKSKRKQSEQNSSKRRLVAEATVFEYNSVRSRR